jgi:hypothetical protein
MKPTLGPAMTIFTIFLMTFFVGLPHLATFIFSYIFFFSMTEPELGAGIDPGMALTLTIFI